MSSGLSHPIGGIKHKTPKGEIRFTAELEEILKRITEIKNIAGISIQ
jgi:hypothetical protein